MAGALASIFSRCAIDEADVVVDYTILDGVLELGVLSWEKLIAFRDLERDATAVARATEGFAIDGPRLHMDGLAAKLDTS
jgi:hypothetical protein